MIAYAVHLVWAAFGVIGFLLQGVRQNGLRLVFVSPLLVLLGVLAGTHTQGRDYRNYFWFFHHFQTWSDLELTRYPEFGFQALLIVANRVGWSYATATSLLAVVLFGLFALGIRRIGHNEALYIYLYIPKYFFQGHINQIRSSILYPFVILMIDWLTNGKTKRVIGVALVLSTIHASAILLCFLPMMSRLRLTPARMLLLFVCPVVISQGLWPLLASISDALDIRQLGYIMRDIDTVPLLSVEVGRRAFLFGMATWLVVAGKHEDPVVGWICRIFVLGWLAYVALIDVRVFSDRLGALFGVVEPLLMLTFVRAMVPTSRVLARAMILGLGLVEFSLRALVLKDIPLYVP